MDDPVAAQVDACNRQDVDAFCACCADDVAVEDAQGKALIGSRVIDEERVTGRDGPPLRAVALYRVQDGRIRSVRFVSERD